MGRSRIVAAALSAATLVGVSCSSSPPGTTPSSSVPSVTTTTTTTSPGPVVPAAYRSLYDQLAVQLDAASRDARLGADAGVATRWGVELLAANGNRGDALLSPPTLESVQLSLDRYAEMGVTAVTVAAKYPLLAPWFSRQDEYARFYARVAAEVRARGLGLFVDVSPLFTGTVFSDVTIDPSRLTYAEFTADETAIAQRAIDLMQPDWLVVIDEPDTAAKLTGIADLARLDRFVAFVNRVVDGVDRRQTKLVAGAGTWMPAQFLTALAGEARVDVVGLHVYPVSTAVIDTTIAAVDAAHARGKSVVLDEAWLYKAAPGEAGGPAMAEEIFRRDAYSFWAPLDAQFLEVLARLARSQGLTYVAVFWAGLLFSYVDWSEALDGAPYDALNRQLAQAQGAAMRAGSLSPTGERYEEIVRLGRIPS